MTTGLVNNEGQRTVERLDSVLEQKQTAMHYKEKQQQQQQAPSLPDREEKPIEEPELSLYLQNQSQNQSRSNKKSLYKDQKAKILIIYAK